MDVFSLLPIDIAGGVTLLWIVLGLCGLALQGQPQVICRVVFPVGAVFSLALAITGFWALSATANIAVLPLGLPDLPFHLRLDPLSGLFLILLGGASFGVSLFSSGYFKGMEGDVLGLLSLEYHVFLAGMTLVILADDAYMFMVAWETMALSSYFLVTTDHNIPDTRRAGFLYLLIAHVGAIAILLSFGVMQAGHGIGAYTFDAMRASHLSSSWASIAFLLALFGFGAKAGVLPMHVWLPEAHPAAPSPVSALMSGVMLKTAIYGILRVTFDLLDVQLWWWGVLALALGLITALFGVMFAAVQVDMKRLLAYSSIENIGLLLVGIGLTIIFHVYGKDALAALALTATLYHSLNHACFKSLLFVGTGSIMHATGERNMGRMGGLIKQMPWLAALMLVGVLAISGLPPLNGFVSEWLLLQAFLLSPGLPNSYIDMLVPVAAAVIALAAALAAYVMVKFFGVIFLGQPREAKLEHAHDAGLWERAGMVWLALACVVLGLAPVFVVQQIDPVSQMLLGSHLGNAAAGWMMLTPMDTERASYSPVYFLLAVLAVMLVTAWLVHHYYHGRLRRGPAWDCGFPAQNARMQDTAEGFGQPIRRIFDPFFKIESVLPTAFDAQPKYHALSEDRLWYLLYLPMKRLVEKLSGWASVLQHGHIHLYLTYTFVTLIVLLIFV
ncbi:MAG: hydrogenase 4 subunit B [Gallionellaceae bacterium CG1_02_56_997]|nr:MAG: hydrogenase 4 subunit B [Gallionellaceae bacterium CG1_02_56_997]PIX05377.1 MAG: hydrogenase 4 subunit B [Gallionellales bacterium CG_4_8_14_3_um_filter_54_18]PJC04153.1 MAG: hydrogenase 4 subunit B [Gallionellales bacterium CG_4_9_14_0_8_um_filter_55_61]